MLCSAAFGQTLTGAGTVTVKGAVTVGPQSSQYVKIFALSPPETDPDRGSHFATYVMTSGAIDGVTESIIWSNIETGTPSATPCTPVGSDTCQIDSTGWYHNYSWTATDSTLSYWFTDPHSVWGTKIVNIIGVGQTEAAPPNNANFATPYYVTTPSWIAQTGATVQDVINYASTSGCSPYTGPAITAISLASAGVAQASVSAVALNQANGFVVGDTVWVSGASPSSLDTLPGGTPILSVGSPAGTFTYATGCSSLCNSTQGNAITHVMSWQVPYESPMQVAFKAFIAASIQHFGPNTSDPTNIKPGQVLYMRFGKSAGGESFVYCPSNIPSYTVGTWQGYITNMTGFEQSQSPPMLIFEPLNRVGGDDTDYSNYEATDAIAHANTYGGTFGFGSQGLSLYDKTNYQILLRPCASNWCGNFNTYVGQASPLELQQIANSDPTDSSCGTGGANCVPGGDSGDLRVWLPFAVGRHLNVLELYSVDADLAFDPNFCVLSGSSCGTGSYSSINGLSGTQQYEFFQPVVGVTGSGVGVGNTMTCTGYTQSSAMGDCSYEAAITTAHGYH